MREAPPPDRDGGKGVPPPSAGTDRDADRSNGVVPLHPADPGPGSAPEAVAELADACVRFVRAAVGVSLDFRPETLPVLDHYLGTRRDELLAARTSNPEAMAIVARAAGAYFGEVVRAHFRSFWHLPSDDPARWEVRFESVYLSVNPLAVVYDAISHGDEEGPIAHLEVDDEDREAVAARLQELPPAPDEEFFSLATRLEVLEIAVDVIKARMMASGLGEVSFSGEDYES
jgi:hypothetical protein